MTQKKKLTKRERAFIETVWKYFHAHGRHELPWRKTTDPYTILVSEVMLQQTQVERVIPKYHSFLKEFPTINKLASASLGDVLRQWQGLGYNRRAKMIHACAQQLVADHKGVFPTTSHELQKLPGIGPYTAAALCAFAYNQPVVMIETNIRTVYLHHFFKHKQSVRDADLLVHIENCVPHDTPREWYAALMDYGSHLKQQYGNPNSRSTHYVKQTAFKGSNRQVRGSIMRLLSKGDVREKEMSKKMPQCELQSLQTQLNALVNEGLIQVYRRTYRLPR